MSKTTNKFSPEVRERAVRMVRERELRSAAVWRGLATQARRTEINRIKAEETRAANRAAETAANDSHLSSTDG